MGLIRRTGIGFLRFKHARHLEEEIAEAIKDVRNDFSWTFIVDIPNPVGEDFHLWACDLCGAVVPGTHERVHLRAHGITIRSGQTAMDDLQIGDTVAHIGSGRRAQEAAMNAARGRAWRRLAARHPEEFRELYEKEKRRFGHEGS